MRRWGWGLVHAVGVQVDPQVPAWPAPWGTLPAPVLAPGPRGPNTVRPQPYGPRALKEKEPLVCPKPSACSPERALIA